MRRRLFLGAAMAALVAFTLSLVGCGQAEDPWQDEPGSVRVVVTIAPLASLVRGVAGDHAAIKCLCTTTGPHHYQLDTRDARVLGKAELFLAVGLRLDDHFADAMRSVARRQDLPYFKVGQAIPADRLLEMKCEHEHGDGDHAHHHGKWDPHVWLGLPEVIEMVKAVRAELTKVDRANEGEYAKNAEAYIARLEKLHKEGKALLADKKVRRIVTFHEALSYFARSFDLEIVDVIEVAAGKEPSSAHLAKIVTRCKDCRDAEKKPVGAIAVEPQYPKSTSAATVQKELKRMGVEVPLVEVDPLETAVADELKREGGDWYLARMRKNLEALAKTLP